MKYIIWSSLPSVDDQIKYTYINGKGEYIKLLTMVSLRMAPI
jgi:hypothetical protein